MVIPQVITVDNVCQFVTILLAKCAIKVTTIVINAVQATTLYQGIAILTFATFLIVYYADLLILVSSVERIIHTI